MKKSILSVCISAVLASGLSGCGGSSSSAPDPEPIVNQAPEVTVQGMAVNEKAPVSLQAIATDDGTITAFEWQITSDHEITLDGADTDTVTFTAPEVAADTQVTLSVTVTDDDGETATQNVTVDIQQLTLPLTIAGVATDSPIANALIEVKIQGRDEPVQATADAEGNYTASIELDDSEGDAFITIVARGVGAQESAGLISVLGSAEKLAEQAGDDGTLTAEENFSVNVTNVTTAQYALITRAAAGEEITDDAQLDELKLQISTEEVAQLATAIKTAIDKAEENPEVALPDGVDDTLALIENLEEAQAYIQEVQYLPEFEEAKEEMFSDEKLMDRSGFTAPNAYHVLPEGTLYSSIGSFVFNQDGSGLLYTTDGTRRDTKLAFTWVLEEGALNIQMAAPEFSLSYDYVDVDGDGWGDQVAVERGVTAYAITPFATGDKADQLNITEFSQIRYPNGEFDNYEDHYSALYNAIKDSGSDTIDIEQPGAAFLPIDYLAFEPLESMYGLTGGGASADKFVFNADGTGSSALSELDFSWSLEGGELVLTPADPALNTWTVNKLNTSANGTEYVLVTEKDADGVVQNMRISEGAVLAEAPQWDLDKVAGIYVYDRAAFSDPLDNFWFELDEDGSARTISTFDDNGNGQLEAEEFFIRHGEWIVNDNGALTISRYRPLSGAVQEDPACAVSFEGCYVYHERSWHLVADKGEQITTLHHHDFKPDQWVDESGELQTDGFPQNMWDVRSLFRATEAPVEIGSGSAEEDAAPTARALQRGMVSKPAATAAHAALSRFAGYEPTLN